MGGVEGVVGGDGDDRLLGDGAANQLLGGAGDDVADGRAGDDRVDLGVGSNRARGGPGDDTIAVMWGDTPRPLVQRVSCGPGRDRVSQLFRNDFAEDDCETVVIAEFHELQALLPPARWERPPLASYSTTPEDCEAPSCRLDLDARLARSPNRRLPRLKGLLVGQAMTTVTNRGLTSLTLNLSDRGARLLRRYRELLIRIRLNIVREDQPGFIVEGEYITRLRAPTAAAGDVRPDGTLRRLTGKTSCLMATGPSKNGVRKRAPRGRCPPARWTERLGFDGCQPRRRQPLTWSRRMRSASFAAAALAPCGSYAAGPAASI